MQGLQEVGAARASSGVPGPQEAGGLGSVPFTTGCITSVGKGTPKHIPDVLELVVAASTDLLEKGNQNQTVPPPAPAESSQKAPKGTTAP